MMILRCHNPFFVCYSKRSMFTFAFIMR